MDGGCGGQHALQIGLQLLVEGCAAATASTKMLPKAYPPRQLHTGDGRALWECV
jgi:hypothetical protein